MFDALNSLTRKLILKYAKQFDPYTSLFVVLINTNIQIVNPWLVIGILGARYWLLWNYWKGNDGGVEKFKMVSCCPSH